MCIIGGMTTPVKRKNVASKKRSDEGEPTVPDLVILSLLAERPMHGYELNATLEERQIREWGQSRGRRSTTRWRN